MIAMCGPPIVPRIQSLITQLKPFLPGQFHLRASRIMITSRRCGCIRFAAGLLNYLSL